MISKVQYDKLLRDNTTKSYKPAPDRTDHDIVEARDIAPLPGSSRINCMAKKEAFMTLQDHKENFARNLPCGLINPAKSEMGRTSKRILDIASHHGQTLDPSPTSRCLQTPGR